MSQDKVLNPPLRFVISDTSPLNSTVDHVVTVPTSQIGSLARFGHMQHEWRNRIEGECMVVHLAPKASPGFHARVNPHFVLAQCVQALFAPSCSHPPDQLPDHVIEDHMFVHPDHFFSEEESQRKTIAVYAVRGNDPLRMMVLGALYGLAAEGRVVVGGDACLACSLKLCRRANVRHLVC